MTALGWTYPDAPVSAAFRLEAIGPVALVLCTGEGHITPRDRLRRQLHLSRRWTSFLPLAPRASGAPDAVRRFTSLRAAEIARRLADLENATQLSVAFQTPTAAPRPGSSSSGAGWLRRRAQDRAQAAVARADLIALMGPALDGPGLRAVALRPCPSGLTFDLLVDRDGATTVLSTLGRDLPPQVAGRPGLSCAVTGPLPAYGFCDLPEAA